MLPSIVPPLVKLDHFFAQNSIITIIPKIKIKRLELAEGEFGPFLVGRKIDVPLWLATLLNNSSKCSVTIPTWLEEEFLNSVYRQEQETPQILTTLLPFYFFDLATIWLKNFMEYFPKPEKVRILIQNIRDVRKTKIDVLISTKIEQQMIDVVGITSTEITELRQFLDQTFKTAEELTAMHELLNVRESKGSQKPVMTSFSAN